MCTLTFRLFEQGYQVFFNRDELKSRVHALPAQIDCKRSAIYPIDPLGGGTWIAVNEKGLTLALLNYYQKQFDAGGKSFVSRGTIIPKLLESDDEIESQLKSMDLRQFQAFQLCSFNNKLSTLSSNKQLARAFIWDGKQLTSYSLLDKGALPVTSSGVEFERVYAYRKQQYQELVKDKYNSSDAHINYHHHQGEHGQCSVKMFREDAQTVSFTQIKVTQSAQQKQVQLIYQDHLDPDKTQHCLSLPF